MAKLSMHGLDLSFLKNSPLPPLKKGRKVKLVSKRSSLPCPQLMRDVDQAYGGDGFKSPVDGRRISSRSHLRSHNRANNVRQCGEVSLDQYTSHVEKKHEFTPQQGVDFKWIPRD